MGQLLVRKLDDEVKRRLQERARRNGVSMEEEARAILRTTLLQDDPEEYGLGTQIANLFKDIPDNDEPFERPLGGPLRRIDFSE